MNKIRVSGVGIALLVAFACAALIAAQQQTSRPPGAGLARLQATQTSRDSRLIGIDVVRTIETAEVEHRSWHGSYASWTELYHSADEQKRWQHLQLSAGPEVVPGWKLDLVASSDGQHFELSLRNVADPCGFSFFSDEHGLIYQGGAIDCSIELKPAS